jgi:hypothetical protein
MNYELPSLPYWTKRNYIAVHSEKIGTESMAEHGWCRCRQELIR